MKVRLFALLSAVLLFVLAAIPASASTSLEGHTYLALGDSVAFGYNPLFVAGGLAGNPNVFVGYPEIAAASLGMQDVNASCPGETSGGFISLTNGEDFKCQLYRFNFPLHVDYTTSQLDFTIGYLRAHPDVRLITMDIGANDAFKAGCTTIHCVASVVPDIEANLRFIFGQIRNVAHYQGALVTLTYYSLSYDPVSAASTRLLNAPIMSATLAFGGEVASGFDAFKGPALAAGGSSCAAGLLIVLSPGVCDVHPSPLGRDLLANAVVNAVAPS